MGSPRRPLDSTGRGSGFIRGLSPYVWYRYGIGITVTGAGVSTWADQSGNARDLLQGTDANRPALQSDNSILFDGVSSYLDAGIFTHNQPVTWYLLMKQVTWTDNDRFCTSPGATGVLQRTVTPRIRLNFGLTLDNDNLAVGSYGVVCSVANGASSVIQVNNTSPVTGDAGASNPGGFLLGAANGPANFANIQVKEVILFGSAHDTNTRTRVIRYLSQVGNLGV